MRAVWERMRWESDVNKAYEQYGEIFRCNNNLTRWYGRWFNAMYAWREYGEFFETREHGNHEEDK